MDHDSRSYLQITELLAKLRDEPARVHRVARFRDALDALTRSHTLSFHPEKTVLVAGTNGKGSVSKMLETLLATPGRSVGLFTSPHMMETTERIRSEGKDLSQDEFVRCYELVAPFCEGLSHFEVLTLMACEAFFGGRVRRVVDVAIVEVGVGGRLDPTRLIPHGVSVVTKIGLDHEDLLGGTLEAIAREKFAIVDQGNRVVVAPVASGARAALEERMRETSARYTELSAPDYEVVRGPRSPSWKLKSKWGDVTLSLKGLRAVENANVALHALEALGEDVESRLPLLAKVDWPCRMEGFEIEGRDVYLSGDHNAQGAESLVEILREFARDEVHLVVGLGMKKNVEEVMRIYGAIEGVRLHLTTTPFRGGSLERYGEWLKTAESVDADPVRMLEDVVRHASAGALVVVTGSLYLTGDLRKLVVDGHFGETKAIK